MQLQLLIGQQQWEGRSLFFWAETEQMHFGSTYLCQLFFEVGQKKGNKFKTLFQINTDNGYQYRRGCGGTEYTPVGCNAEEDVLCYPDDLYPSM